MRGRLRVVADGKTTWAEVPSEYWEKVLEKDKEVPVIDEPILPVGTEIPNYGVHHGGDFDDDLNGYHGGELNYFDMCAQWHFNMHDMESMMTKLGLELGQFCLWFCNPDTEIVQGLIPLVKSEDVETLSDFIREEREYGDEGEELPKENEGVEDDKLSFEGDSSNVNSSDSEVEILPKKKKRIPPPNPPYMTRKKGRYSMLRVEMQVHPVDDTKHEEDNQEDLIEDIVQKIEDSSSEDGYNSDGERMAMS
ncbi:hypothetical protein POM88_032659 [Heracleum sosnowskyi]|uniref:PB1-like domain-containing protein n=1 Tax=Heracleum sosnowskyi TaxID=360622 RepID=A0AAD8I0W9_9APIA|nr:hypothetical protein POM88_032659 [Heracleum sosnowskyi]